MHTSHSLLLEVIHPLQERRYGFSELYFTVVSGLVSAYRFYKDYTFKKNVRRNLHYFLDGQNHFRQDLLTNKKNLSSLAEIASSNFKDIQSDFNNLKADTNMNFDTYLSNLMHTTANGVFYKNYLLYYVNILNIIDHDLVGHNNEVECMKTLIFMKYRTFISGLHVPAGTCRHFIKHFIWVLQLFLNKNTHLIVWICCESIL